VTWSALQASRILWGLLVTRLVPPGAALVLGADDTGRRRRPKTRVDGVRQMRPHVRRWLPGRTLVLGVAGGLAAVALALAWGKRQVPRVSRLRWDAALSQRPGPHPPGTRGPNPWPGNRQGRVQGWAERPDPPGETGAGDWSGDQRRPPWGFSHTALGHTPGVSPVERCVGIGCAPAGTRRLDAWCCPDLPATPGPSLAWVVRRWSGEVTGEEGRAQLGLEPQRHGSALARARTTPVLWALGRRHRWRARSGVHSPPGAASRPWPQEALARLIPGLPRAASWAKAA